MFLFLSFEGIPTKESFIKTQRLTQQELQEELLYEPETGYFFWLKEKKGRDLTIPAGTNASGYIRININGVAYSAHRLAFLYVEGEFPPEYVDHRDGDPSNNSWDNLRHATAKENSRNRRRKYNSYTGVKGVVKNYVSDTWDVHMRIDDQTISRGPFFSYQAACKEYDRLASVGFGEFYRKEKPRQQRANFKNEDVTQAVEAFIKDKELVNGVYVRSQHSKAPWED